MKSPDSRQRDDEEFLKTIIDVVFWPWTQFKKLYDRLPGSGRIVLMAASGLTLYWLYESGALYTLLCLGVVAFVVTVILHESVMSRKYPHAAPAARDDDEQPRRRRRDNADEQWWQDMMDVRQREEEDRGR
jgi:hypothetical protein